MKCAFGILQARSTFICCFTGVWSEEIVFLNTRTCILLRIMIMDDERDDPEHNHDYIDDHHPRVTAESVHLEFSSLQDPSIHYKDNGTHGELK